MPPRTTTAHAVRWARESDNKNSGSKGRSCGISCGLAWTRTRDLFLFREIDSSPPRAAELRKTACLCRSLGRSESCQFAGCREMAVGLGSALVSNRTDVGSERGSQCAYARAVTRTCPRIPFRRCGTAVDYAFRALGVALGQRRINRSKVGRGGLHGLDRCRAVFRLRALCAAPHPRPFVDRTAVRRDNGKRCKHNMGPRTVARS